MSMPKKGRQRLLGRQKTQMKQDVQQYNDTERETIGALQKDIHEFLTENYPDANASVVAAATMLYSSRVACQAIGMNAKTFSQAAKDAFKATQRELQGADGA